MTPAAPDVDRARARPCPYRARAWWGERLVAETTSALRVEAADGPPLLCFPLADVRLELFRDEGRPAACPAVGTARAWSIDGQDVLWTFPDSGTPEWMRGLAAFDHDRVRVELVDAADGDAPREAAVTRFPTWGDALDLVDVVDRWMLYRHLSTFAGDGMTHAECRVHDDAGDLLASFTVDAMVRPFAGGAPADDRRALP